MYYPYAERTRAAYYAFRLLGSAVILLSVYAVSYRRRLIVLAGLLAIPALEHRVLEGTNASAFSMLNISLSFAFDALVVVLIFHRVFVRGRPDSETVFGALSIYLLVGFSFASIYGLVAAVQPRAFYLNPATNLHSIADRFDFVYYSFATLTSLGASGITPVSHEVRSLSVIEAMMGLFYLAVLIARLMGAYRPRADA